MYKSVRFSNIAILLLLMLSVSVKAQKSFLLKSEVLDDLQYLEDSLPKKHINLYNHITKEDFRELINQVRNKADVLDFIHFRIELYKVIAKIGDEHTFVVQKNKTNLSIEFKRFKEGLFVTAIDSVYGKYLLSRLLSINNCSLSEIQLQLKQVVPNINSSYFDVAMLRYINDPSFLSSMGLSSSDTSISYLLEQGQLKQSVILTSSQRDKFKRFGLPNSTIPYVIGTSAYWFGYDKLRNMVYLDYKDCRDDQTLSFAHFNEQMWDSIEKYQPNKIIVDLRDNGGGNSAIMRPFIERLKNSYLNKNGKLFVLIGPRTFSSALMNAVELKRSTNCILVGQPTSGNINHYGEVRGLMLPNTKIEIGYSTRNWVTWEGKRGNLVPDVSIIYSITNFSKGIDEALSYVYKK